MLFRSSGQDSKYIYQEALKIKQSLDCSLEHTIILGPTPLPIFRVNNIYRYGIILKYKREDKLRSELSHIKNHYKTNSKVRIDIDFSPSHF